MSADGGANGVPLIVLMMLISRDGKVLMRVLSEVLGEVLLSSRLACESLG